MGGRDPMNLIWLTPAEGSGAGIEADKALILAAILRGCGFLCALREKSMEEGNGNPEAAGRGCHQEVS